MNTYSKVLLFISVVTVIMLYPTVGREEVIVFDATTRGAVEKFEKSNPRAEPVLSDVLKKISWCESRNKQFRADGSVVRGEINPQDVGKYQINEYYHLEESKRLGMNIYTLEGNTQYAKYLYSKQGSQPWHSSKDCWSSKRKVWIEKGDEYWIL